MLGQKTSAGLDSDSDGRPFSVVISTAGEFSNEQKIACRLIDAGLSRFHLRKPDMSPVEMHRWVEKIPKDYRQRIVVHANPDVVRDMDLGGLHLRAAQQRPRQWPKEIPVSQSCHSFNELSSYARHCAYATLGPVFPSISKNGYIPQRTPEEYAIINECWQDDEKGCPVLALGGITVKNISRLGELGFAGFAVVGSVWEQKKPVEAFRALLKEWK
ncbi:MAG: thiamine phosphate synthase [Puniceicoccales bacterium]|jgi:thiamine-phosphate pyrophosphorylase|nr:thiamine phosphate synthase [Puniceicoccales bacterium]